MTKSPDDLIDVLGRLACLRTGGTKLAKRPDNRLFFSSQQSEVS